MFWNLVCAEYCQCSQTPTRTWNLTMYENVKAQHVPKWSAVFFEVNIRLWHIFKLIINLMSFVISCRVLRTLEFLKNISQICAQTWLTLVDVFGYISSFLNCFKLFSWNANFLILVNLIPFFKHEELEILRSFFRRKCTFKIVNSAFKGKLRRDIYTLCIILLATWA